MAETFSWEKFLKEYKWQVLLGFLGLIFVISSIFLLNQTDNSGIQIIPIEEEAEGKTIFVDLQGAVEKPGLYELAAEARLNDLLIKAGGLSAGADRDWVEKNLNLAQKLIDGAKLYIPEEKELGVQDSVLGSVGDRININRASLSELDSLWGIGQKRAADIIANRPYQTIEELKDKKIIPQNVFQEIKEEICVY